MISRGWAGRRDLRGSSSLCADAAAAASCTSSMRRVIADGVIELGSGPRKVCGTTPCFRFSVAGIGSAFRGRAVRGHPLPADVTALFADEVVEVLVVFVADVFEQLSVGKKGERLSYSPRLCIRL